MPRFDRLELGPSSVPVPESAHPTSEPRDEKYWLGLADADRRRGMYENALRYYSRALEQDKSLTVGWIGQVQMLVLLGEYPEADLWARKALELFRNQPELLAARSQALCRKGDRNEARAICDGAFAQPGQSAFRWIVRGELMVATGQDMDRYCFDKAIQAEPDWLVPLEVAGVLRFYDQPSKALVYLRKAAAECPDNAHIWYQQAMCEDDLGLLDHARRSLRRCLELQPQHTDAAAMQAKLNQRGWSPGRWVRGLFRRS
jgi:tetratricopeptide (TPR) repeat protein